MAKAVNLKSQSESNRFVNRYHMKPLKPILYSVGHSNHRLKTLIKASNGPVGIVHGPEPADRKGV